MIFQKGSEGFNNKSNKPDGFCGRKATFKKEATASELRSCVKVDCGRPGLPVPDKPDGFCGRKATLNRTSDIFRGQEPPRLSHSCQPQ